MSTAERRPTGLLSDSCSICHKPPKYRCPRCRARTCSLPCTQRHKRQALCSGIRNPISYQSREQLAHHPDTLRADFDLLTRIERGREKAERVLLSAEQGVSGVSTVEAERNENPISPSSTKHDENRDAVRLRRRLQKALSDRRVNVIRAPAGLTRHRRNRTVWDAQHGAISWTVEWIVGAAGEVQHVQARDDWDVVRNYRQQEHDEQASPTAKRQTSKAYAKASQEGKADRHVLSADLSAHSSTALTDTKAQPDSGASALYYYLQLIPQPPNAPRRVLHLRPGRPLREWFRDRAFLEFPTIYVLGVSPTELDARGWAVDNVVSEGTAYVIDTTGTKEHTASEPGKADIEV